MRWFLIDMVEWEWVKSTNKIKAVLLLCDDADDVAGVDETQQRDEDLEAAVEDFDVLVLQQAAHDGYIGLCIRTALSAGGDLSSDTSRPVLAPPGVVCRDVKGQEVAVLRQTSDVQVEADDKDVPGHPHCGPHRIHHYVARSVLNGAKQAQDDNQDVEEVSKDRSPLIAQEIKHLPLQCHHQLKRAEKYQGAPSATAAHCVVKAR